jgi:hypothetical protein
MTEFAGQACSRDLAARTVGEVAGKTEVACIESEEREEGTDKY